VEKEEAVLASQTEDQGHKCTELKQGEDELKIIELPELKTVIDELAPTKQCAGDSKGQSAKLNDSEQPEELKV
jgi:hypothetical protein